MKDLPATFVDTPNPNKHQHYADDVKGAMQLRLVKATVHSEQVRNSLYNIKYKATSLGSHYSPCFCVSTFWVMQVEGGFDNKLHDYEEKKITLQPDWKCWCTGEEVCFTDASGSIFDRLFSKRFLPCSNSTQYPTATLVESILLFVM